MDFFKEKVIKSLPTWLDMDGLDYIFFYLTWLDCLAAVCQIAILCTIDSLINNACCCNTLPSIKFYVLYENFRVKGKFEKNSFMLRFFFLSPM